MGATEDNAQEDKDSGSLIKQTRIEKLTAKLLTYPTEEQHMDRAEVLWRKRWKIAREALAAERKDKHKYCRVQSVHHLSPKPLQKKGGPI